MQDRATCPHPFSQSLCLTVFTIHNNLTWTLYVHGKKVNISLCPVLESVPVLLQPISSNSLLEKIDTLNVCIGNPEENFVQLCDASHHWLGNILSPDGSVAACQIIFEGVSFDSTVRSSKCSLVVNGVSKYDHCKKYRSVLRAMHSRQKKCSSSSEKTIVSSHVNYRYLSVPEKAQRMANLKAEVVQQRRKVELLEEKVKKLTEKSGVEVDEQIHGDLSHIMEEMTHEVEKEFPENSFERVF